MRGLLAFVLLASSTVPALAGVDPMDAAVALPIELSDPSAAEARIDVPPAVFGHLQHGTDDLRVIDVEGTELWCAVLTRDGSAASARSDLEPRLVSQSASPGELALLFDLRVRAAPGLWLELDLRGAVGTPLHVSDANDPRTGPWEEIPFVATESTDDRLTGRAVVPSGAAKRFVRVVVPTRSPESVRLARAAATIPRHRVYFRTVDGTAPFTLLAGFESRPAALGPNISDPRFSWGSGEPARVLVPAWLEPEQGLGTRPRPAVPSGSRPFPWAEVAATILLLALTIWSVLLRRER